MTVSPTARPGWFGPSGAAVLRSDFAPPAHDVGALGTPALPFHALSHTFG